MYCSIQAVPGSFRDPSGRVYFFEDRVIRIVAESFVSSYEQVVGTGLFSNLESEGMILPARNVEPEILESMGLQGQYVLEVPKLSFVSFPYEWPFSALKDAALLHLRMHLTALQHGVTLTDASAYNVQFQGVSPVFIDHLSFRPYEEGEVWSGHRQFCEQFLNPLLLRAYWGIPHNAWYRGTLEGIPTGELCRLMRWRQYFQWNMLMHVVMQHWFQRSASQDLSDLKKEAIPARPLPLRSLCHLLEQLHNWIESLQPADTGKTVWSDYATNHSYSDTEMETKKQFVREFVQRIQPKVLWDLGCNTGDYSAVAIEAGAEYVVGFDADQGALELGYSRGKAEKFPWQLLYLDGANPSPNQGWREVERQGLSDRAKGDGILALAFIHHLAIARNIPLDQLVDWLVDLAPHGVVEFVPKNDPMVQKLLRLRDDIFPNYSEDEFLACLVLRAEVIRTKVVSQTRRVLIEYRRIEKGEA